MTTISLRRDRLKKFCKLAGIKNDTQLAARMDMDRAQVSRILNGKQNPGEKFIGALLIVFGPEFFTDLFDVASDKDAAA